MKNRSDDVGNKRRIEDAAIGTPECGNIIENDAIAKEVVVAVDAPTGTTSRTTKGTTRGRDGGKTWEGADGTSTGRRQSRRDVVVDSSGGGEKEKGGERGSWAGEENRRRRGGRPARFVVDDCIARRKIALRRG